MNESMKDNESYKYCTRCGAEDHGKDCQKWRYVNRVANGDIYDCPYCGHSSVQEANCE